MSVSAADDAVMPTDVSVLSDIPSNDSAFPVLFKQDASLPDASTEVHGTANNHLHTVPVVYNEEIPEHESKLVSTPPLESGPTTSDSLAVENDLGAAVPHVSVLMKETTTNGPNVDATTAEHSEPLTSESVMAIAATAEESGADKSIGHDSGIEILAPAEEVENGHVPADRPDIEVVDAMVIDESDAAASIEDAPENTGHIQVGKSSIEEVTQVEATEATMATEDYVTQAVERAKVDIVTEDQPQAEVTFEHPSQEPAAETNGSEGERKTVRGVEVEQETVHEAEPAAAAINNVEDNAHEATLDQHQPAQDAPHTALDANGPEATLHESEEPEVTVHVQETSSIEEYQGDHVTVDDAVETAAAPVNHDLPAAQASFELTPEEVVVANAGVPTPVEAATNQEAPAVVEVDAAGGEINEAPAAAEEVVVVEQIQNAAVVESAAEEVPSHAEVEIIPEVASKGVSAPVEAQPVASDEIAKPMEAEHGVEVPEVLHETTGVVEAEVATSEEVAMPEAEEVANELVPTHVEDEPTVEAIGATASTEVVAELVPPPSVPEVLNVETLEAVKSEHVVSEEIPAPAEVEPATEAIEATTSDEIADETPVAEEPVDEVKATTEAPVGVEPNISADSVAATTETPAQDSNAPLLVSDAEPKVSVQAVLKGQEAPESQAGIRDNTEAEVVSKPTSVALATCAVEETAKEISVEEQPDSAPECLSAAPVTVEQPAPTSSEDNDVGEVEPLTELTTEPLSIQTSVDTTPFTPVVDSGIELKEQEQESQPPNLLSIVEEIERPKSPWSPSFQVTTVGQGNLLEDAQVLVQDSSTSSELNDATKMVATPVLIVEDATDASAAIASDNLSSTDEQSLEASARPWTPSYSVHLQGTPVQATKELPLLDEKSVDEVIPEQVHGSTFEDNEAPSEQRPEVAATQQETDEMSVSAEDVALADMTEPSTDIPEIAVVDIPEIAVADESVKEVMEFSLQPQEEHLTSDTPNSSAKLWTPSYSVHAQGSPLQPPDDPESVGAENVVLAESVKATAESKAVEGLNNANADFLTSEHVASIGSMNIENEKLVDEDTKTGRETIDDTTLEASEAPSYSVHVQGTPVIKSAVPRPVIDVEPFGVATSNGSASLEPPAGQGYPETKDVGDLTAELPVLSVSMESSENTTPEALEEPWTPSYSVHSQGSPLIPRAELHGVDGDAEADVEPSAEAWTPSYSVHLQGSSTLMTKGADESLEPQTLEPPTESRTPLVAPRELEDIPVHDVVEPEAPVETEAQEITPVSLADSVAIESHSQNDDTTDAQDKNTSNEVIPPPIVLVAPVISLASLGTAAENSAVVSEVEGPAGPPTSSYSVHSQGSPSLDPVMLKDEQPSDNHSHTDETEVRDAQQQVSEGSGATEVALKLNGTSEEVQSDHQVAAGAPVESDAMTSDDKTIPALLVSGAVLSNVPERPWTPSYSVTQQGSGLPVKEGGKLDKLESSSQPPETSSVPDDIELQLHEVQSNESNAVQIRPGQVVGSAEDIARNEKFMLFGLRAIVAYLWVLPRWLSSSPSESGHSRREASSSSSSSKFFPGGWFLTKPNEGRTSLDTAQGEFAASPKTTSDAFETINVETMYREAGGSTGTATVEDGTNGQNRRWCIVM